MGLKRPIRPRIDTPRRNAFHGAMKLAGAGVGLILFLSGFGVAAQEPRLLAKVTPLPVALSDDFQFRKTKLYFLGEQGPKAKTDKGKKPNAAGSSDSSRQSGEASSQDTSIRFERSYRLFGALTKLDQHQRYGNYFDFFWRAKRPADVTVRLEYRQEKLHDFVQAQEISYGNVHGNHKTEFKVVGDDYFDDGRVMAWRCLLIEDGRIVAENRSYLWE
jgi:hypothetical protein